MRWVDGALVFCLETGLESVVFGVGFSNESGWELSGRAKSEVTDFGGRPSLGRSTGFMPSAMYAGLALFQLWSSKRSVPFLNVPVLTSIVEWPTRLLIS